MRIWLITIGEPWPTDGENPRLLRTGVMAQQYARAGDEVVWFNGTFDHYQKAHRYECDTTIITEPRLTLVGLYGRPYHRNVSLARILHHRDVRAAFCRQARRLPKPDVIVVSMPPLELSLAAVRYGQAHGVPVVVDIRDLWPDIWLEVAPKPFQGAARLALQPYYRMLRISVDLSSALTGVSDHAVEWGLAHATRPRHALDGVLPLAYEPPVLAPQAVAEAERFWSERGIEGRPDRLTLCYFGNISRRYEFDTVFDAAEQLPEAWRDKILFVLCGQGERDSELRKRAARCASIVMPGWIDAAQIEVLKQRSQIGLLPYPSSDDYVRLMPNKVFDYLTGGLPILTCLRGATGELIEREGCGWMYENNAPDTLARILVELAQDPVRVRRAAQESMRVARLFSAAEVYGKFRERLGALVAEQKGRGVVGQAPRLSEESSVVPR
jgi:glycosyltransferase involved in cell wall biosynthesis